MKIKTLICSVTVLGAFSFVLSPVQAAACSHKLFQAFYDYKTYYFEEDGHYGDWGPSYICADCGYQYWEDSELVYQRIEDHQWSEKPTIKEEFLGQVWEFACETPGCPYTYTIPLNQ